MTHPAYGVPRRVGPIASVVLEDNPSEMTLEGTNSWVLRAPGADGCVVVDPGYHDLAHLEALASAAEGAELVILTHFHGDHAEGAPWLADRLGVPVRAFDPSLCAGAEPLADGEVVAAAGLEIKVLHTPGHTADSVTLLVEHDGATTALTGDTILGRGTTVLENLGDYLRSLRALIALPPGSPGLPGHGPELADLPATARAYLAHREERIEQVRSALRELGPDATARQIVELVYADVDRALWVPAEYSVRAQLDYLRTENG
ncbi:MBL fold metallo-hydrolase [Amycolatopsis minnesotensis]|uniref:MBL fold metallo-hydrolase n=1 Tax=Amycolatopsis minnesotensis TaxID=337894 RepID=A0ABN2Q3D6_9PSEU